MLFARKKFVKRLALTDEEKDSFLDRIRETTKGNEYRKLGDSDIHVEVVTKINQLDKGDAAILKALYESHQNFKKKSTKESKDAYTYKATKSMRPVNFKMDIYSKVVKAE